MLSILAYFVDKFDALRDMGKLEDLPPLLALAFITIGTTWSKERLRLGRRLGSRVADSPSLAFR
jgi:hypothetical protein